MVYGYARVSTKGQARDGNSLEAQRNVLTEQGAAEVFYESFTGTKKHRPELDRMLSKLKSGDTVIVTKLDRIARNTKDGIEIIDAIVDKGCAIRIMNMGMFDNTPTGRLMKNIMLSFAEFERDMIVQRTQEGKAIAREKEGYREGRPPMEGIVYEALPGEKWYETCKRLGISKSQWYNMKKKTA